MALLIRYIAIYRGLYSKFFSKKCMKCSSFENDDELMLIVIQAYFEQQQQCFRLILLDEHVNELLYPIRIQFVEFASQIDPQTVLKAFLFYQIFHVNFLQFGLKTHHFGVSFQYFPILFKHISTHFVKQKIKFLIRHKCYYAFQTQNNQ